MPPAGNFLLVQKVPQKIPPAGSLPAGRHSPLAAPATPTHQWGPGLPQGLPHPCCQACLKLQHRTTRRQALPLVCTSDSHPSVGPRTSSRAPPSLLPGLPQTAVDNNSFEQPLVEFHSLEGNSKHHHHTAVTPKKEAAIL